MSAARASSKCTRAGRAILRATLLVAITGCIIYAASQMGLIRGDLVEPANIRSANHSP